MLMGTKDQKSLTGLNRNDSKRIADGLLDVMGQSGKIIATTTLLDVVWSVARNRGPTGPEIKLDVIPNTGGEIEVRSNGELFCWLLPQHPETNHLFERV